MAKKRDRWPELCEAVATDDNLPVRNVGAWSEDKLFWWHRYIDITSAAMFQKFGGNLCYVDLFAGPGVCVLNESKKRIPGSVLIAAMAAKPFKKIVACELNDKAADACEARLARFGQGNGVVLRGDCNAMVSDVRAQLPATSLTLSFIDPEGLHVHFQSIATLTDKRKVDLLILFADRMDLVRNVAVYEKQKDSKLDRFLGSGCDWRAAYNALDSHKSANICRLFSELYQGQLQTLGYKCESTPVESQYGSLYKLIYASKSDVGIDFWNKSVKKHLRGHRELPGFGP